MNFSLQRLYNRRSKDSIRELNWKFLGAIPRDWDHAEASDQALAEKLVEFVDNGADIDTQDNIRWTALSRLAIWGYTKAAAALIERGASIDPNDQGGLMAWVGAAQNNNVELLRLLLSKAGDKFDLQSLRAGFLGTVASGCVNGQEDQEKKIACIEMLLEKGVTFDPRDKATAYNYPYLTPYVPGLAEAKEMEAAVEAGDLNKVKELLDGGLNPDCLAEYGQDTPLFKAAVKGDLLMMEELIRRGANINIVCSWSDRTPLMAAAESGKLAAVELLVNYGVDIDPRYRYERTAYDEPPHIPHNLYDSAREGGQEMQQRIAELTAPTVVMQRRARIMKPLRLGKT